MKRIASICLLMTLAAALVVIGTGCADGVPKDPPGITGTVTDLQLEMEKQTVRVLVTADDSSKAEIMLTSETKVYGPDGEEARAVELNQGMKVRAWYEGSAQGDPAKVTATVLQMME